MKKSIILLLVLFLSVFASHGSALETRGAEIRGDQVYNGNFAGFRGNQIQIELSETRYRVSLPLADDVAYLHKSNNYAPFPPEQLHIQAPVKAIEVDRKIVQVILLGELHSDLPH